MSKASKPEGRASGSSSLEVSVPVAAAASKASNPVKLVSQRGVPVAAAARGIRASGRSS